MTKPRLSMKLLWKFATEYQRINPESENTAFLYFVELKMKTQATDEEIKRVFEKSPKCVSPQSLPPTV